MPSMPRPNNKCKEIAEKILGINKKETKEKKKPDTKIEERLIFEETSRVR